MLQRMYARLSGHILSTPPDVCIPVASIGVPDGQAGEVRLYGEDLYLVDDHGKRLLGVPVSEIVSTSVTVEGQRGVWRLCFASADDHDPALRVSESNRDLSTWEVCVFVSPTRLHAFDRLNRMMGTTTNDPFQGERTTAEEHVDSSDGPGRRGHIMKTKAHTPRNASPIRRLLQYAWPYRWTVGTYLALLLLESVIALLPPYFTKVLIDGVLNSEVLSTGWLTAAIASYSRQTQLLIAVGLLGAAYLTSQTLKIILGWKAGFLGIVITRDLRSDLFEKMQRLPMSYFDRVGVGSLISRINQDAASVRGFLVQGAKSILVNFLRVACIPAMLFAIDWRLALWSLVPIPPILFFSAYLWPRIRVWFSSMWARRSELNQLTKLLLEGIKTTKTYGQEERMRERFEQANSRDCATSVRSERYMAAKFSSVAILTNVGTLLVWYFGGWFVIEGTATIGTLVAFTTYLGMLYNPVQSLSRISQWWNKNATVAQRMFNVMDRPAETTNAPSLPGPVNGSISLDSVTFTYASGQMAVQDVSLDIKAGETIGLVGLNGAGKSSLVHLITRLYQPTTGRIRIDGHDLHTLDPSSVRKHVGLVTQESMLFDHSIYDNIAFGAPDATAEDVLRASEAAGAHSFIMRRNNGYDSVVGNEGNRLSGGEKQRICLARALVCAPDILILDEPTASLDAEASRSFLQTVEDAGRSRTTIIITHELSAFQQADRLAVLQDGKLVDIGTHDELMVRDGHYAWLVRVYQDVNRGLLFQEPDGTGSLRS